MHGPCVFVLEGSSVTCVALTMLPLTTSVALDRMLSACYLFSCPQDVKEAAYKGLVRPVLEYGSSVWDPHTKCLQEELEKVQNRAARFVTRNYTFEEGSMTGILEQLRWESLKKRRTDNRHITIQRRLPQGGSLLPAP